MKRKFFVVVNPASGAKKLEIVLRELVDFLVFKNHKFEVFLTAKSQNGWKTVEEHFDESYSDLVILGGDGTINEAVNRLKYDRPISIIPTGTRNDFVKMLDLGSSLEDYIQVIDHGKIIKIDLGVCNGRKFVNGVGIGFDGQIVADMNQKSFFLRGPAKYYYFVLRILASCLSHRFKFKIDDKKLEKDMILLCVANGSTFGGNFKLTPAADLQDGRLDICEVGKLSSIKRFLNIYKLRNGTHGALEEVNFYQATKVEVAEDPDLNAHIDGEYFGIPPFKFEILPQALQVRVKKSASTGI